MLNCHNCAVGKQFWLKTAENCNEGELVSYWQCQKVGLGPG